MSNATGTQPLVLLVFDAADMKLAEQWMDEGYLPHLAAIRKRGAWARLGGAECVAEQGTRLTAFSGVSRAEHGFYWFRRLVPGAYDLSPYAPADSGVLPFWQYLAGTGKRVATIDAPESAVVPGLPGIQVAEWSTIQPDLIPSPPVTEPAGRLPEVRRVFGSQVRFREFDPHQRPREDRALFTRVMDRTRRQGRLCRHLLKDGPFDLVVAGFYEAHKGGHQFWKYRRHEEGHAGPLATAVRDSYQAVDREIGLLLERLPDDANVFILSFFGMNDGFPFIDLPESFCRAAGYQAAPPSSGPRPGLDPMALARRLVPETLRTRLSNKLPRSTQERLLSAHFRDSSDWSRTRVFAIPSLYGAYLRVNLRGREPQGVVEPGADYEALLDHLESDLRKLTETVSGTPLVDRVTRGAVLSGGAPPDLLPDLFVEWVPLAHLVREASFDHTVLRQEVPGYLRDTQHSPGGFLAAAGPAVRPGALTTTVDILDLAPTFLHLLNTPSPKSWRGRVEHSLLRSR